MFPMSPLQSWALLALTAAAVILFCWLVYQVEVYLTSRRDETDIVDPIDLDAERTARRPQPVETRELYDWAKHGI